MTEIPMGEVTPIPMGDIPAYYAARQAESACIVYPDATLTWGELERESSRLARAFEACGVVQDDLVTIALPNCIRFHVVLFALWKLGATPHIISPALTSHERREIVELAAPRVVVGIDPREAGGLTSLAADFDTSAYSDASMASKVATHWRAMSSGGSTGRPKIIVEHNPSLWGFAYPLFDFPVGGCVLNPGPLYHSGPFAWSAVALFQGNLLIGMTRFDATETLDLIDRHGVNWVQLVPTMMHRIWKLPEAERQHFSLKSLRTVLHMAAPMPVWLKEQWIAWLGPERVMELYGGTESIGITVITGGEWLAHKGSVGRPIAGEIRILNDDGSECAAGESGNVCFGVPPGSRASYHYIGARPNVIAEGWETIGDIGWMDEDGYLYLADRKADMIISGGANIYPAEVEAALMEYPGVEGAVVVGLPHEDLGQVVHAIVKPFPDWKERLDVDALRDFLTGRLVRYKTPRSYEFVEHGLRDDAGKIRRSRLATERMTTSPSTHVVSRT